MTFDEAHYNLLNQKNWEKGTAKTLSLRWLAVKKAKAYFAITAGWSGADEELLRLCALSRCSDPIEKHLLNHQIRSGAARVRVPFPFGGALLLLLGTANKLERAFICHRRLAVLCFSVGADRTPFPRHGPTGATPCSYLVGGARWREIARSPEIVTCSQHPPEST